MAKLPRIAKSIPKSPPSSKVPRTQNPAFRPARAPPRQATPVPTSANEPHLQAQGRWQRVWDERPRVADLKKLPDEALRSPEHIAKVNRWKQWPLFVCGLAAFGMGVYGVQLYISLTRESPLENVPEDVSDRFDREADGYDEKVDMSETLLLLTSKRKELTKRAKGHVLEVAVGTGRNIPYYKTKQCATVTLLDSSGPMLAVAKRKWKDTHTEYFSRVFFKQQSALDPIVPPYGAQDGYDTVIQTMGLCSTGEPVKLLQNMEAATKEDGQILLLEHGKSHYEWLNNVLDKTAPNHADAHGCWWNKDIGKIVEMSGLEVVNIKRYNLGTTWWVELKPRKGTRRVQVESAPDKVPVPTDTPVTQKPWWSLWR